MPEISVIVPVYKVEPYIHRCVDSILAQTFMDFELILVDDGSPDNCGVICDEYAAKDNRIHVIHQDNQGQAAARNHALDWIFEHSDSEYISFVDSDDWVHPRYLELLREGIKRYAVNICQCGHLETEGATEAADISDVFSCVTSEEQYVNHYSAFMWDKLFTRSCWENMRFPEGQIYEDVAIWYKILFKEERVALTNDTLYYYFVNPDSTVRKEWTTAKLAQVDAWEEQIAYLEEKGIPNVLEAAWVHYCQILTIQLVSIAKAPILSLRERKHYQRVLRKKLRVSLRSCQRFHVVLKDKHWYFGEAYPRIIELYWIVCGVLGKLKKIS